MTHYTTSSSIRTLTSLICVCAAALFLYAPLAVAATPTPKPSVKPTATAKPTPSPTATPAAEVNTTDVRRRVEEYVEKNRDKVQGAVDAQAGTLKAVVGEIESVTAEALSVSHRGGKLRIPLESELQLVNKDIVTLKVSDAAVGNWAIVIGTVDSQNNNAFVAKRVIVLTKSPFPPERTITLGSASKTSAKSITIVNRKTNEERTYLIDKNTAFSDSTDTEFAATDLRVDHSYIVIGVTNSSGDLVATQVRSLVPVEKSTPTPRPRR